MVKYFAQFIDKPPSLPETPATGETIQSVLGIVFGMLGALAILVIVIAGLVYVTSSGDSSRTAQARNAIIYAAVGLAIAGASFIIVEYVVGNV